MLIKINIIFSFILSGFACDRITTYFNRPAPDPVPSANNPAGIRRAQAPSNVVPSNQCGRRLYNNLQALRNAGEPKSMDIMMYEFNDDTIIAALLTAARHGATIRLILVLPVIS